MTFGIGLASSRALDAVSDGIAREEDGLPFAGWLADTYRDETAEYVDSLATSTLYARFLSR